VLGLDFDANNPTSGDGPRLTGWANDAVVDMLKRTHCFIQSATMTMTSGQGDYRLDSSILAIDDVYMTSGTQSFRATRMSTTDLLNARLFQVVTAPITRYALAGADLLMVFPTPSLPDVMTIYYVPRPSLLVNSTDDPSSSTLGGIPSEYHYGLELYMQWKAGDAFDDESSQSGETYRRQYVGDPSAAPGTDARKGFIGEMKRDLRDKGGKHLGAIVLPPRTRRTYIPLPGVDMGSQYE
jgi:hypothetical protein